MEVSGPAIRFGPFDVLSRIGIGGMGEVFRARLRRDPTARDVALKLLRPEHVSDEHFREMFLAESRIHALLDHPRIARLVDFGEVDHVLFLATEFVAGVGLDALLGARALSTEVAIYVVLAILDALQFTHELTGPDGRPLGLVHRDVSPSNILLSRSGDVKLTDFGIHKISGQSFTHDNELKGKVAFMAPEQLPPRGPIDRRADLFSVGVLLHHLVLRRAPFTDVAVWIREGAPLAVDGAFGELITHALAVEPTRRIGSADELAAGLRRIVRSTDGAAEQLGRLVEELARTEQPLGNIDRLILSELAGPDASDFIYAPDPTTKRLWIPKTSSVPTPSKSIPLAESDLSDSEPTSPLRAPAAPAFAVDHTVVEDRTPDQIVVPPRRRRRRGELMVLASALVASIVVGAWVVLREPGPAAVEAPAPPRTEQPVTAETRALTTPTPPAAPTPTPTPEPTPRPARVKAEPAPSRVTDEEQAERAPRRKPRPAPATEHPIGYLTLDTEPWATVYLGGRRLGTTPFMRVPLPAGHHQLTLDVQDSGQRLQRAVDIPTGGVKRLALRLP